MSVVQSADHGSTRRVRVEAERARPAVPADQEARAAPAHRAHVVGRRGRGGQEDLALALDRLHDVHEVGPPAVAVLAVGAGAPLHPVLARPARGELRPVGPELRVREHRVGLDVRDDEEAGLRQPRADVGEERARSRLVRRLRRVLAHRLAAELRALVHVGVVDDDAVPALRLQLGEHVGRPLVLVAGRADVHLPVAGVHRPLEPVALRVGREPVRVVLERPAVAEPARQQRVVHPGVAVVRGRRRHVLVDEDLRVRVLGADLRDAPGVPGMEGHVPVAAQVAGLVRAAGADARGGHVAGRRLRLGARAARDCERDEQEHGKATQYHERCFGTVVAAVIPRPRDTCSSVPELVAHRHPSAPGRLVDRGDEGGQRKRPLSRLQRLLAEARGHARIRRQLERDAQRVGLARRNQEAGVVGDVVLGAWALSSPRRPGRRRTRRAPRVAPRVRRSSASGTTTAAACSISRNSSSRGTGSTSRSGPGTDGGPIARTSMSSACAARASVSQSRWSRPTASRWSPGGAARSRRARTPSGTNSPPMPSSAASCMPARLKKSTRPARRAPAATSRWRRAHPREIEQRVQDHQPLAAPQARGERAGDRIPRHDRPRPAQRARRLPHVRGPAAQPVAPRPDRRAERRDSRDLRLHPGLGAGGAEVLVLAVRPAGQPERRLSHRPAPPRARRSTRPCARA